MATKTQEFTASNNFGTYDNVLHCQISETTNDSANTSTISCQVWVTGTGYLYNYNNYIQLKINGVTVYDGNPGTVANGVVVVSRTTTYSHNTNGTGSFSVYCYYSTLTTGSTYYTPTINSTYTTLVISRYKLSISAGTGSSVTVNRNSSPSGSTGAISNGANLYYGDVLKISFSANTNYAINTHTVNGTTFTSGNTHTVSGNVTVVTTATVLASRVGATNADIGSRSTITVTRYNSSYYHSLQYSFGSVSGYINSDGSTSATEVKYTNTSVSFLVPTTFYAQIPSAKTGTCTITCRTYSSSSSTTVIGTAATCTFTATASSSTSSPQVSGTVVDTNATTIALTGNSSKLIRYKSTAQCTISATARNSATISSKKINDVAPTNDVRTFSNVDIASFTFSATDSRGYSGSATVTPTRVNYIVLTCNPEIYRPTPTGSIINMKVSGNYFGGSFGSYSNTLTVRYQYREVGGSYSGWTTISSGISTGSTSYSSSVIELGNSFDYTKSYQFQVNAYDGANGTTLSTVTKTIIVQQGIPVFDWGKADFNVNYALNYKGVNIFNVIYPVNSVYMSTSSTIPSVLSEIGTWTSITSGISGVYAWQRTE